MISSNEPQLLITGVFYCIIRMIDLIRLCLNITGFLKLVIFINDIDLIRLSI